MELNEVKTWYKNGQLKSQRFYRDGELEGERKVWRENGNPWSYEFYQDNKLEGEWRHWCEDGLLIRDYYRNGKSLSYDHNQFFTVNTKHGFLRIKRKFRNKNIHVVDMLILDLMKIICNFIA